MYAEVLGWNTVRYLALIKYDKHHRLWMVFVSAHCSRRVRDKIDKIYGHSDDNVPAWYWIAFSYNSFSYIVCNPLNFHASSAYLLFCDWERSMATGTLFNVLFVLPPHFATSLPDPFQLYLYNEIIISHTRTCAQIPIYSVIIFNFVRSQIDHYMSLACNDCDNLTKSFCTASLVSNSCCRLVTLCRSSFIANSASFFSFWISCSRFSSRSSFSSRSASVRWSLIYLSNCALQARSVKELKKYCIDDYNANNE